MDQIEQLKEQLKKQEKLASLGLLSAGIAHEIQNPLNFVINFSKMSDKLLADLTEIVEDNKDKLPDADREEMEGINDYATNSRRLEYGKKTKSTHHHSPEEYIEQGVIYFEPDDTPSGFDGLPDREERESEDVAGDEL